MKHLVFFDSDCALCLHSVARLLKLDRKNLFAFAPLNGKTADKELTGSLSYLKNENTLILIENYQKPTEKRWVRGKGVFRIFWLLGDQWRLIGWLAFTPFGQDALYRLVAKHRRRFFRKEPMIDYKKYAARFYE